MKTIVLKVLGISALLFAEAPLFAQTAQIAGRITDPSDAVVANASVTVTNAKTGVTRRASSNQQGYYAVPLLQPGAYDILVQNDGFKPVSRKGVTLLVDQVGRIDFVLEIGSLAESVSVIAAAPLVDSSTANVGKVIESRRVADLPINGRNALALEMLTPGVKSVMGPTNSGFISRGNELSHVSINGGPSGLNNFMLDGGTNVQGYNADLNVSPSVEAIEEFKVQTHTISAEFGFTAGGVVNIVTKSGVNIFHGSLYEFLRNSVFDARNAFAPSRATFGYNQFGGSAGGPILLPRLYSGRNRSFFFFNYEENRYRTYEQPITTMPTAEQKRGDFSALRDSAGRLISIYDPGTTRANPNGSGFVRDLFPSNIIPNNRLDPVAANILPFYPLPNRTPSDPFTNSNNYVGSNKNVNWMRQFTARVDHRFNDRNSMYVRGVNFRNYTNTGGGTAPYPDPLVRERYDYYDTRNLIVADVHAFSPNVLNELKFGINRLSFDFNPASANQGWPQKLGMPATTPGLMFPIISNGLAGFNIGNIGRRTTLTPQLTETVSMFRGKHSLKFGADFRQQQVHQILLRQPSGQYTFPAALTGNPQSPAGTGYGFSTFLLGEVGSAIATTHVGFSMAGHSQSYFFQDDWRVTSRLTLNLGLRYDYQSWPKERNNGTSNFNPFAQDPRSGLPGRLDFSGIDYQGTILQPDRNNWGPRIGFAYDITGRGRTVIRAGYSILYPFVFYRPYFEGSTGFAETVTNYAPPGNNTNVRAFQFRNGLPSPAVAPLGSAIGPSALLGQNVTFGENTGQTAMSQQWSASVQQQLRKDWLVEVTYAANHGTHLIGGTYDFNQLDPANNSLGLALQNQIPNPYAGRVPGAFGAATISRQQSLRPYPHYGNITVAAPGPSLGNSIYHSVLVSVEKRFSMGLSLLASFTGAKMIDDSVSAAGNLPGAEQALITDYQNGKFNRRAERATDPTDVARRLVISGLYELPWGPGRKWRIANPVARALAGGWQINIIGTFQTGIPLAIRGASNFLANRPNSTGVSPVLDNPTAGQWFNTNAFVNPPNFTYGNLGRTVPDVRTPGTTNVDCSLIKNTPLRERVNLQFRAEAFNFANHVNLGLPNSMFVPGPDGLNRSGTFGTITTARDARILQLALKLIF